MFPLRNIVGKYHHTQVYGAGIKCLVTKLTAIFQSSLSSYLGEHVVSSKRGHMGTLRERATLFYANSSII